jgi:dGTPase
MINDILDTMQNNIEIFKINELELVRNLNKPVVHFSNEMQSKVDSVRLFLSNKMYNHDSVNKMTDNAKKIISFLYVFLLDADDSVYDDLKINLNQKEDKSRIICDFISGMTDNFAQSIYEKYS